MDNKQKASYDLIINKVMEYLVEIKKADLLKVYTM